MEPNNILKMVSEPVNKILTPPAEKIGNTLASIWNLTFGWIDHIDDKLRIIRQQDLCKFSEKLETEISKIPVENRIEPKLSIAGPTLEATKYYIEEEELQNMFAKLLANSMNRNTAQYIQHSFVEIIKQMTPIDAQNIIDISFEKQYAICQIVKNTNDMKKGYSILCNILYWLPTKSEENWEQNSISLVNLQRLGLIQYGFEKHLADDSYYKHYYDSKLIKDFKKIDQNIILNKGFVEITSYGQQFQMACLPEIIVKNGA